MIPFLHGALGVAAAISDFELIETQTVGAGGAASVTFSSIPQTYKHLQIRYYAKTASLGNFNIRFNGDNTAANYRYHALAGTGSAALSTTAASNAYTGSFGATYGGAGITDILDYTNTSKNKTVRDFCGWDGNGNGEIDLISNLWLSTAAITSIVLSGTSTIQQYSTISLYGVK